MTGARVEFWGGPCDGQTLPLDQAAPWVQVPMVPGGMSAWYEFRAGRLDYRGDVSRHQRPGPPEVTP